MANKHLSEDELKYVITADASKAQQELHKLEKDTSNLRSEEKRRRDAMISLEAAGKKNSGQYQKLSSECKEYTARIKENENQMREIRNTMDIYTMTMNQLKKHSKDLHREFDDMSKAADPKAYMDLENKLHTVDARISELKQDAKGFMELASSDTVNGVFLGNLLTKAAMWFGNLTGKMREFIGQGIEMAETADGITHAFRQLNNPGLLDKLHSATKGTINDVQLMKDAVKANDLKVPLDDLGKYLEFARIQARNTGQSVDELTDKIIMGLGKHSAKPFAALGISAGELNGKIKETGYFMSAISDIVDTRLAKSENGYISASEKALQRTTALQNAQLEMGQSLLSVKEAWADAYGDMAISIMHVITWLGTHRKATLLLTIALAGFNIAMSAANLSLKEFIASSTLARIATNAWNTVVTSVKGISLLFANVIATMSGNTTRAAAAMKLFNQTCKANVYILAATAIVGIVSAMVYLISKSQKTFDLSNQLKTTYDSMARLYSQTKEKMKKDLIDIQKEANKQVAEESSKIKILTNIVNDNTQSNKRRRGALDELRKIVPAYHAQLTNEGKLINNNSYALENYIKNLRKTAMEQAIVAKMTNIAESQLNNTLDRKRIQGNKNYIFNKAAKLGVNLNTQKVIANSSYQTTGAGPSLAHAFLTTYSVVDKATGKVIKGLESVSNNLYRYQQIFDYRNTGLKKNDKFNQMAEMRYGQLEDYASKNNLNLVSTVKEKPNGSTPTTNKRSGAKTDKAGNAQKSAFSNDRKQELDEEEIAYQESMDNLKGELIEKSKTQEQYDAEVTGIELLHTAKVLKIEQDYSEKSKNLKIKDANEKKRIVIDQKSNEDKAKQSYAEKQLAAEKQFYDMMQSIEDSSMTDTEKQKRNLDLKLTSLQVYYETALSYARQNGMNENSITEAYEKAKKKIIEDNELEIEQKKQQIRQQYGLVTQQEQLDEELRQLKKHLDDQQMSQEDYEKAVADIKHKYADKAFQDRQQLGLVSQKQIYDQELAQLRLHLEEVHATEEESARAVTALKSKQWKEQYDYYAQLFGGAMNSLIQAEEANVDAKYDAEIQAAQGNTDKVEMLEKKKANAKLKIEKKYADIKFAITASQIVADTAASIIETHKSLGGWTPAAIAAAILMGISGAAQLAAAVAERNKVKNMTLESTGSSSSSSGARVATGREDGGSIDVRRSQDGKLFNALYDPDKRGYVDRPTVIVGEGDYGHSKEWIASNSALNNPTVAPLISIIDQHQRAGTLQMLDMNKYLLQQQHRGLASGGSVSPVTSSSNNSPAFPSELITRLYDLLDNIRHNGIPATVALDDFDAKVKLRDQARKIASK